MRKSEKFPKQNGKLVLWSLNNFKAVEFTWITMHEYRAVVKITTNKFIYLHKVIGNLLSFFPFILTHFYSRQYIICVIFFEKNARNLNNYRGLHSYLSPACSGGVFMTAPGCRTGNIWSIKRSLLFLQLINIG